MAAKQEVTKEAAEGVVTDNPWVRAPSAGVAWRYRIPPSRSDSWRSSNNSPGGWGNRGKTGGGTEDQVRAEEMGLDRGAETDSEALEDLGRGAVADSGTLEDLGRGAVADSGTLEDLGRGAMADSGTLEDLGCGAMADSETLEDLGRGTVVDSGTLEQKSTMLDSEEPGAMAGQAEQAEQGAMEGQAEQTGAKIPTVEQMTSIAEQRVHDWPPWP
ncbi:hypothetical protein M9458_052309 [Cirrhinus mrigala]|uniref:Uncharacterized protein n=1 Tax=Cirrhinus mrigala TaxID=683832 RepID=A0ABD0MVM0_CIRMR